MENSRPANLVADTPQTPEDNLFDTSIAVSSEEPETESELTTAKPIEKKKITKARELEEIRELPISKLTDKEKENLIKALKEENTEQINKNQSLKNNCEMAFEKLRNVEAQYSSMENYYLTKLKFIGEQMQACHNAIAMAIKGGIQ